MYLGMPLKVAAFRRAGRPIHPILLQVQSAHRMDGTGVTTRNAAFHANPTPLFRNALMAGSGLVPATGASQSQPLLLLIILSLLTTIVDISELRSIVPTACALTE
jgi:hypothetical protein